MQTRRERSARVQGSKTDRPLPAQLVRNLGPKAKQALAHPLRRRILRALGEDPSARAITDLLAAFPTLSLSVINYHLLVLEECGSISACRAERPDGAVTRTLVSNVADDAQFVMVLRATEDWDEIADEGTVLGA